MQPCTYIDPHLREDTLSEDEQMLRKAFVDAYIISRNPIEACVSIGFMSAYAASWAESFMKEGYVLRLIKQMDEIADSKETTLARRNKYRAWMEKQANYYGEDASHGARVSAIKALMQIEGMDEPTPDEGQVGFKGGVMMVPSLTNPDNWGELAALSQGKLKQTVRD